jgi:hypothetical protein
MILNAIATHPLGTNGVVMVATDGVYFREPHPGLELSGTELGKWDVAVKENLTLFMPGVYWDDETRKTIRNQKPVKVKSRGINGNDLGRVIPELDEQFKKFNGTDWPTVDLRVAFSMTSASLALARGKWDTAGNITINGPRTISSDPVSKRYGSAYKDGQLWRTHVYEGDGSRSTPYSKSFGIDFEGMESEEGITPDGYARDAMRADIGSTPDRYPDDITPT